MTGKEDDEQLLKTPPELAQRTTPYGTPTPGEATTGEFDFAPASLAGLRERYDLEAELGRGGMGIVYRARDRETGGVVALKVLRPEIASRPEVIERFKSELLLARKVTHKNVCRTYELLRFGNTVAIAMEYVEGESLRGLVNRVEALPVRRALKILRPVLTGLAEAHAQGVVHRDLKPENIVVARDNQVKVMDFGIARSVEAQATQTGSVLGTPAYMSPEQAEGKPVDARTDIYALGLIMYELFVGRPAFQAETPVGLAYKQIHEKPLPPRSVDPYLPVFLERVIEKCLEKDPKKRFQSVAELEAALEEQAVTEAPEAEPAPAPHLSVWGRRDWYLLAVGVIGLIYFLAVYDAVFPASRMRLEIDAIGARRVATEVAARIERPFPPSDSRIRLQFRGEQYRNELVSKVTPDPRGMNRPEALRQIDLPLYWEITFGYVPESLRAAFGEPADEYVVVDRKGKVEEFSRPSLSGWPRPNYQVPTVEQRRAAVRQAYESACGPLPSDVALIETAGGEQGASYTATWRPVRPAGAAAVAEVALLTEKVIKIKCKLPRAVPDFVVVMSILSLGTLSISRLILVTMLIVVLVYFGMGECHRTPILWKRLPLAVVMGLAAVWVLAPAFGQLPNSAATGSTPSFPLVLGGGLAAAALMLVGLVTAEHFLARRTPATVAGYRLAWRGRIKDPSVGLAVVRGALAGLGLGAVQILLWHLSLLIPFSKNAPLRIAGMFLTAFADPAPIGQALASLSPALFVISAALLNGVIIGLIFLASQWAISGHKEFAKHPKDKLHRFAVLLGMAANAAVLTIATRLQFGQSLSLGPGFLVVPLILLCLLTWLLLSYDVLTVIVAAGTAVLWTLNYPLLQILEEVGNAGQWGVFVCWVALVAAAAASAFRSHLAHIPRRLRDGAQ